MLLLSVQKTSPSEIFVRQTMQSANMGVPNGVRHSLRIRANLEPRRTTVFGILTFELIPVLRTAPMWKLRLRMPYGDHALASLFTTILFLVELVCSGRRP